MTPTQRFYFKLINALLDSVYDVVKGYNECKQIEHGSKSKSRFDPVSAYDNVVEIGIIDVLNALNPNASIYGEECGISVSGDSMWFIDPIDGTKSFVSGSPVWGTILGIANGNNVIMGAVDHPMLSERLIAVGGVTYYRARAASFKRLTSQFKCDKRLSQCVVATSSANVMTSFERVKFSKLARAARNVIYYYDCYAYTLLIKGYIDVIVECHFKPYDFVGLVPILKGIGCFVCDWQGNDVCYSDRVLVSRSLSVQNSALDLMNAVC
ncbi:inositol monophosphatase family protein [Candidatus Hodgkinia cicadicola]